MDPVALNVLTRQASTGGGQMVHRTSTGDRDILQALRDEAAQLQAAVKSPRAARPGATSRPARKRRRPQLARLLLGALTVVFLTGSTSYRMHLAMRTEQQDSGASEGSGGSDGALAGLRSWLSAGASGRRSLREGGLAGDGGLRPLDGDAGARAVQIYDHWWMLGGDAALPPPEPLDAAAADNSPLARLLRLRRLHPAAVRVFDFQRGAWVPHNITRFPQDLPMGRWGVATLLNKAKKKESAIFLVGGYQSAAEVAAAARAGRPPRTGSISRGAVAGVDPALDGCPLASAGVWAINPGRTRVRPLPPLPLGVFGAAAVVAGARLHVFGGWSTPDRTSRLAVPQAGHWSIGLNADGSSAPEWEAEAGLPPALTGRHLTTLALSPSEDGEPAIYAWAAPRSAGHPGSSSSSSSDGLGSAEAGCVASPSGGGEDGGGARGKAAVHLWSYAASTGWRRHGPLPQPLADDPQCAVAATPHQLLAVGAPERAGFLSRQRGVWEFDARRGGRWMRAGWAPLEFRGSLCAIHHGRLFVSRALPPHPPAEELAAQAAQPQRGGDGQDAQQQEELQAAQTAEPEAEERGEGLASGGGASASSSAADASAAA